MGGEACALNTRIAQFGRVLRLQLLAAFAGQSAQAPSDALTARLTQFPVKLKRISFHGELIHIRHFSVVQ